jgi:hypothetical protein
MFEELEASANYDDMASYDPDAQSFSGPNPNIPQRTRQKASFDLIMNNTSGEDLTIEIFNELRSFVENLNPSIVTSATATLIPQSSDEGLQAVGVGIVGYDKNGALILTGATPYTPVLSVQCPQYTLRALTKSSGRRPFRIVGIRMTVTTNNQIDNEIVHFTSNFLGASNRNVLSPRTFFNPQQFQTNIVDIQCNFPIDDQKGFYYKINAGELVKWNVLIER